MLNQTPLTYMWTKHGPHASLDTIVYQVTNIDLQHHKIHTMTLHKSFPINVDALTILVAQIVLESRLEFLC